MAMPSSGTVPTIEGWSHVNSGKVRDLYVPQDSRQHQGEIVMIVASDRISAYDHVLTPAIPDKGRILTALTLWWFEQLEGIVPTHVVSTEVPAQVAGRAMICRHLRMYPVECVVRGYLTPSVLEEYESAGTVGGVALPTGLEVAAKLPEPIFTPARKAEYGQHDEDVSFEHLAEAVGLEMARRLRDRSLLVYRRAAEIAAERGIVLADTKLEFGASFEPGGPEVVLGDEVLTPDSSRLWFADEREVGKPPSALDKQLLRDWLDSPEAGWDRHGDAPPPPLPAHVVEHTRERYVRVYEQLTGRTWDE